MLPIAMDQPTHQALTHRHREQAPSHIDCVSASDHRDFAVHHLADKQYPKLAQLVDRQGHVAVLAGEVIGQIE